MSARAVGACGAVVAVVLTTANGVLTGKLDAGWWWVVAFVVVVLLLAAVEGMAAQAASD